jgi:hypothetical protein
MEHLQLLYILQGWQEIIGSEFQQGQARFSRQQNFEGEVTDYKSPENDESRGCAIVEVVVGTKALLPGSERKLY